MTIISKSCFRQNTCLTQLLICEVWLCEFKDL